MCMEEEEEDVCVDMKEEDERGLEWDDITIQKMIKTMKSFNFCSEERSRYVLSV